MATKKTQSQKKAMPLGQTVPDMELSLTGAKIFRISQLKGKKVVLYFYPKDSTPGCTLEGRDFTQLHQNFKDQNTEVYGVSRDSLSSHEKFKSKECYTLDLISDPEEKLCDFFGVMKQKNSFGKSVRGIERSTFVLNEKGQVVKEWRAVKVDGHAQEVLNYITGKES